MAKSTEAAVKLQRLEEATLEVPIVGVTPVIPHAWAEKAKSLMREKQMNPGVRPKKTPKDPTQDAHDATYWIDEPPVGSPEKGTPGIQAAAFKAATVGACRFFEGLPMTKAKQLLFVVGQGADQLVPFEGTPEFHEDTPRNADGTADLRHRYYWLDWRATLQVRFLPSVIDKESVLALVDAGGKLGVGDWRPSSPKSATGIYGQYRVEV